MTLIVRKEGSKPIYISVFCGESIALKQYQHELKAFGYHLKFPSQPLNSAIKESYADIYIIDIAELEQNKAIFQVKNVPFLVYGLLELPKQQSLLDLLYHAAGYFMDEPSLSSIRLNIQLGLQRHRERENYSQRVQDISEKIENNRFDRNCYGATY